MDLAACGVFRERVPVAGRLPVVPVVAYVGVIVLVL